MTVTTPLAEAIRAGLLAKPQRRLPSAYLYDALGSALFEAITLLPEYGLTRADARLLQACAPELARLLPDTQQVAELGSGTGQKARAVLEALSPRGTVDYYPIDVSPTALARATEELESVARVTPLPQNYLDGLRAVTGLRDANRPLLVLFLGSTLGNCTAEESALFLQRVRGLLRDGDALLVGTDLVKDTATLLLAYDDPVGVTAAFNRNVLGRVNRELGGDFDLAAYAHEARWNAEHHRVEMHLRVDAPQRVRIEALDLRLSLEPGETIWTESSHKFTPESLDALARAAGYVPQARWLDAEWPFAESLWAVDGSA